MASTYFYTVIVSFASGIFLGSFFSFGFPIIIWLLLLALGLAAIGSKGSSTPFAPYVVVIYLALIGMSVGLLRCTLATEFAPNPVLMTKVGQSIELTGLVVREPDRREKNTHLTVRVGDELVLVTVDRYATVSYGDQVSVVGKLAVPTTFETDLGRTFNYPGYLHARGISYTMTLASLNIDSPGQGNPFLTWLYMAKDNFTTVLEQVIPEPQVGLSEGLLLGIQQALGADLNTAFKRTGITHMVVLSGYNVMIVAMFLMYMLTAILPLRTRTIVGIGAMIVFAILVGLSATVVRATIMSVLYLIGQATARNYVVLRGLFFAGAVMLLTNPYLLVYDVGFQLSFMATFGLIAVSPHLEQFLTRVPTFAGVRGFLLATLATQLTVLPILLYQMGQCSLVAVIVNVLVLPAVPAAMMLTFLTGLAAMVAAPLALPFAYGAYVVLSYILTIAVWFSSLPFAAVVVPGFPFWLVPLSYGGIAGLVYWLYRRGTQLPIVTVDYDVSEWTIVAEDEIVKQTTAGRALCSQPAGIVTVTEAPTESNVPGFFR